jgi:hypothetical protein
LSPVNFKQRELNVLNIDMISFRKTKTLLIPLFKIVLKNLLKHLSTIQEFIGDIGEGHSKDERPIKP